MTGVWIGGAALGLYAFWVFARKVVKWGFFTLYFLIGAGITWALNPQFPAALPIGVGIAFAWAVMAIKRKVWKVVSGVALLAALGFVLPSLIGQGKNEIQEQSHKKAVKNSKINEKTSSLGRKHSGTTSNPRQ